MKGRIRSFRYAFNGVAVILRTQPNARIHLLATVVAVGLGLLLGISGGEWLAIILAIGLVWVAEGFNTALELLADRVAPDFHPLVGRAKDSAAAAVLLAAIASVVIALIVYI
ncbi:diacylglycerol kinase family protein [Candidatus Fermentibacteria bacterium]|nr:diacylglycerol kinase family protein [Candidatus Fermentibacteria bacterium]